MMSLIRIFCYLYNMLQHGNKQLSELSSISISTNFFFLKKIVKLTFFNITLSTLIDLHC